MYRDRIKMFQVIILAASFAFFHSPAQAVESDPPIDPSFREAARLSHQNDFESALTVLNKKINDNPKLPMAYANRGMTFYMKGDYDRALNDFNKSLELDAGFAMGYQGKGMVLYRQEKIKESIEQLDRAIKLNPNFGLAYHNRAIAYCHQDLYKSCLADLIKARDVGYAVNPEFIKKIEETIQEEDEAIWKELQQKPSKLQEVPTTPVKEN